MSILAIVPDVERACALPRSAFMEKLFEAALDDAMGTIYDINHPFILAYIECALWSSNDESDESGGEPLDANYDITDIAPETLREMISDCCDFMNGEKKLLNRAYQTRTRGYEVYGGETSAGYDFWLTRNGHGTGFWDRGLGEVGEALSKACKPYGGVDLIVCEDKKIRS